MIKHKIHAMTLRFQDSEIEEAYRAYDLHRVVLQGRIAMACLFTAFLFSYFFDGLLFQAEFLKTTWIIRAGVLLSVSALFAWTFHPRFKQYSYLSLALAALAGAIGIMLLNMQLSRGSDERFFPVVITAVFFIYNVVGTRFIYALSVAFLIVLATYNLGTWWRGHFDVDALLMHNNFILFANLMGGSTGYVTELQRRKLFLGQTVLHEKIEETERAKQEAEQANQAKSRFLAAVSHDLRQPIHAQGMFLNVLAQTELSSKQEKILASINAAATAAGEMLHRLMDLSAIETNSLKPDIQVFRIQPLLNKIESEFMPQANTKGLQYRSRETPLSAHSDPALLEIILRNLLSNAIRYTHAGGVMLVCRKRGDRIVFEVRDSGTGIESSQHREIFREFHQLNNPERDRRKGIGLGLAIVERLAKLLDAHLTVASQPDRGSVFRISVPLAREMVAVDMPPPQPYKRPQGDIRILLIEDDDVVREGTREQLITWGFDCYAVASADDALNLIADVKPDAIISDYRLPGRYIGVELVARIRELLDTPDLPALLITGDIASARTPHPLEAEIPLLQKPVAPSVLYKEIVALLEVSRAPVSAV